MLLVILKETELWKTNKKEFRAEKVIKRKNHKLYVKWKGYNNYFNSWTDKRDVLYMSEYFQKSKSVGQNMKVKLDLSNYATKEDLKNAPGVDTSDFSKKLI